MSAGSVLGLPPIPPAIPRTVYPRWRSSAHALLDGARLLRDLPRLGRGRRGRLNVGVVVHAEAVADPEVFPAFEALCRFFERATGTRMLACVIPGSNPLVRGMMAAHRLGADGLRERVCALAEHAVIGYHGHYFHPPRDGAAPTPMRHADFDRAGFRDQLDADLAWFAALGMAPRAYTGGWWVFNRAIAEALEAAGIVHDFSLRRSLRNTFGEGYELGVGAIDGRPCRLGPRLWELGSFAGLWRYPADTGPWIDAVRAGDADRRFFGLYFHDYDVLSYATALRRMIALLARMPGLRWVPLEDPARVGLP